MTKLDTSFSSSHRFFDRFCVFTNKTEKVCEVSFNVTISLCQLMQMTENYQLQHEEMQTWMRKALELQQQVDDFEFLFSDQQNSDFDGIPEFMSTDSVNVCIWNIFILSSIPFFGVSDVQTEDASNWWIIHGRFHSRCLRWGCSL